MNTFGSFLNVRTLPVTLLTGTILAAFLVLPLSVLYYLNRGLDVSDTGHYYVALYHWHDIKMMSTQFPLVWNLLPRPDNIFINRLLVFILLCGSSAFMFVQAGRIFANESLPGNLQSVLMASIGVAGAAMFYYYWLPDPSYNAIGLILMVLVLGAVFFLARHENQTQWLFKAMAGLAGFSGLALATTRPVTALALIALSAGLYFLLAKPSWPKLVTVLVYSLVGAALFFAMTQVFIEPITITLDRVQGGIQKREILGIQRLVSLSYDYAQKEFEKARLMAPWAAFAASIGGAMLTPGIAERFSSARLIRWIGAVIGTAGLLWLMHEFWIQSKGLNKASMSLIAYYMLNLGAVAFITALLAALAASEQAARFRYARLAGVCLIMLLATQSFSIFGTGLWVTNAAMAAVFTVLAVALVSLQLARGAGIVWALAMGAALLLPMIGVRGAMINTPYRLETSLREQILPTKIRGGRSSLRTDALTKTFFDHLSEVAPQMGPVGERPILIDLSGRMPMAQYHLSARPAYTAWLLSAYEGSDAFLAKIISMMSDEELARAWILDAPGYKQRLDPAPILARGRDLKKDYRIATTAFAPYTNTGIVLLAPKPERPAKSEAE